MREFRNSCLQVALSTINCPTAGSQLTEVLRKPSLPSPPYCPPQVLPTLAAVSRSNQLLGSLTGDRYDPVADWWTSILSCSAHWSLNNLEDAHLTFSDIDQLPELYQVSGGQRALQSTFSSGFRRVCRPLAPLCQPFVTSIELCLDKTAGPNRTLYFASAEKG